jgi:hypothetical protein
VAKHAVRSYFEYRYQPVGAVRTRSDGRVADVHRRRTWRRRGLRTAGARSPAPAGGAPRPPGTRPGRGQPRRGNGQPPLASRQLRPGRGPATAAPPPEIPQARRAHRAVPADRGDRGRHRATGRGRLRPQPGGLRERQGGCLGLGHQRRRRRHHPGLRHRHQRQRRPADRVQDRHSGHPLHDRHLPARLVRRQRRPPRHPRHTAATGRSPRRGPCRPTRFPGSTSPD